MINQRPYRLLFILILTLAPQMLAGQRINFGLYAGQGITLTATTEVLDFNSKQTVINPGTEVIITMDYLNDQPAVVTITAQADLDVSVTVSFPDSLRLVEGSFALPVDLQFAYSNLGAINETTAKTQAVPVPLGLMSAIFPVSRRAGGTRALPPTPQHVGYTPPTATAYLFIYGSLGPVGDVGAGTYTGTINITVEYATHD